jgi:hypothetical protein
MCCTRLADFGPLVCGADAAKFCDRRCFGAMSVEVFKCVELFSTATKVVWLARQCAICRMFKENGKKNVVPMFFGNVEACGVGEEHGMVAGHGVKKAGPQAGAR